MFAQVHLRHVYKEHTESSQCASRRRWQYTMALISAIPLLIFSTSFHTPGGTWAGFRDHIFQVNYPHVLAGAFPTLRGKSGVQKKVRVADQSGEDNGRELMFAGRLRSFKHNDRLAFKDISVADGRFTDNRFIPHTDAFEIVELTEKQYIPQVKQDINSFGSSRGTAALPGVAAQGNADSSQWLRSRSRRLFSSLGLPPVKTTWDAPPPIVAQPGYNWDAYKNSISHSYPTKDQLRVFLGKLQGMHLLIPGPWQNVTIVRPQEAYTEIIQGSVLSRFLTDLFDTWVVILDNIRWLQTVVNVPIEAFLITALREKEDLLLRFFVYFTRLFPIDVLRATLPGGMSSA